MSIHKVVKKTKSIQRYIESLALHSGATTVNLEDKTSCICVVEDKRVTPRFKHIYIPVYFLQKIFNKGLFVPKYDKYSVMLVDMCTKPCSDPIIISGNKSMIRFIFYRTIDTKHYQLMILNEFVVN